MRESYRTEEAAKKARDRWIKQGHHAYISDRHPKIRKFVVTVHRELKPIRKREKRKKKGWTGGF